MKIPNRHILMIYTAVLILAALALVSCSLPIPQIPETGLTGSPGPASQPVNEFGCVVSDLAQVRSAPALAADPTEQMNRGTLLIALARTDDSQWYEVQFPVLPAPQTPGSTPAAELLSQTGWIAAEFLALASEPGETSGVCPPPFPQATGTLTPTTTLTGALTITLTPTTTLTGALTITPSATASFTLLPPIVPTNTATPGVPEDTETPIPSATLLVADTPTDTPDPAITITASPGETPDPIIIIFPTLDIIAPTLVIILPEP